jgi:hypothetical protein
MEFINAKTGEKDKADEGKFIEVPVASLVVEKEWNGRAYPQSDNDIDELARQIRLSPNGQENPIHVVERDGKLRVVNGFGRLEAIKRINRGKKTEDQMKVKALVFPATLSDAELFVSNILDNKRKATSVIDDAYNIERLGTFPEYQKKDGNGNAIMKNDAPVPDYEKISTEVFGKTIGWCRQVLSLRKLPEKIQKDIHAGDIKFDAALDMVKNMKSEAEVLEVAEAAKKTAEKRHASKQATAKAREAADAAKGKKKPAGKAASTKTAAAKGKSADKPVVTRGDVKAAKRAKAPQKGGALTLPELKRYCLDALSDEAGGSKTKSLPFLTILQACHGKLTKKNFVAILSGDMKLAEAFPLVEDADQRAGNGRQKS